jgi:hypothetical protein
MERIVALLEEGPSGTRLIDKTDDRGLCAVVAAHFAALRRAELESLEGVATRDEPPPRPAGGEG